MSNLKPEIFFKKYKRWDLWDVGQAKQSLDLSLKTWSIRENLINGTSSKLKFLDLQKALLRKKGYERKSYIVGEIYKTYIWQWASISEISTVKKRRRKSKKQNEKTKQI